MARTIRALNSDFQPFDNSTATQCGRNAHIERVFLAQVFDLYTVRIEKTLSFVLAYYLRPP